MSFGGRELVRVERSGYISKRTVSLCHISQHRSVPYPLASDKRLSIRSLWLAIESPQCLHLVYAHIIMRLNRMPRPINKVATWENVGLG